MRYKREEVIQRTIREFEFFDHLVANLPIRIVSAYCLGLRPKGPGR
jgi:hypothetical protein